ncbi:MAG: hypothetical protein R2729_27765 [Bryobacteraceae bacterium]
MSGPATSETRKRFRPYGLYLILWSGALMSLSGASYLRIVDQTIGKLPLMQRLQWGNERPLLRVAVLRSASTAVRSGDHPEYYYDLAAYWEHQMHGAGIEFETIDDAQLASGLDSEITVLVLPWAVCMSDQQRLVVRDFVANGHGLVATGPVGARREDCAWNGWEFMTALTSVTNIESFTPEAGTFASFRGRQYYSSGVPPGLLVEMPAHEMTVGAAHQPDVYWSDSHWQPHDGNEAGDAAVGVHNSYGEGRVVWFGYNERLAAARDQKPLDSLALSAIRWAGREPLIAAAPWPANAEAAVVLAATAGSNRESADAVAGMLRATAVPGTIFAEPAGLPRDPTGVETAASGDTNEPVSDQSVFIQVQTLQKMRQNLEQAASAPVFGFKPAQDLWNIDTVVALRSSGFRYFVDRGQSRRAAPELIEFPPATWFGKRVEVGRLGAGWSDDFEVVARYQGPTPWKTDLAQGFLDEFQTARYLYGAYTLTFRSLLLAAPENIHIVRAAVDEMKRNPVWFASAGQLTDWWSRRNKVRVETRRVNQHRLRVAVVNQGKQDLDEASVYLYLPFNAQRVRIISEFIGKAVPEWQPLPEDEAIRLIFPKLAAESSHVFIVALDES